MKDGVSQQYHEILQLLQQYGIQQEHISLRARCTREEVNLALNPDTFEQCSLILVLRIRACIELELKARGWSGNSKDLWREYNAQTSADWYRSSNGSAAPH